MVRSNMIHEVNNRNQRGIKTRQEELQEMNINKQEAERILKSVQQNKVTAVTLRKNDTQQNKKQEFQSLSSTVNSKIMSGKELTVLVIETH